jgi:hypothetical protein
MAEKNYQGVTGVEGNGADLLQQNTTAKQGHKFCGGCCDMRRAVAIVNAVNLVTVAIAMITFLVTHHASHNYNSYSDDSVRAAMQQLSNLPVALVLTVQALQIVCGVLGIMGAFQYNIYMVGIAAAAYVLVFVMAVIELNIEGVFIAGLFAYPHYFFIKEVREGIMTKANYHNEEMSCCCV